ncbi:MAG: hypothetical protein IKE35_07665 [Lachnospiraceae bacterium]|nr:hypothetical protein [Lachnospiraceae bacterium]
MDPEEERVWYLSRVGREKIFKYGTYTVTHDRAITQEHPFYAARDDMDMTGPVSYIPPGQDAAGAPGVTDASAPESAPPPPPEEEMDAEALAAQMISSNFKVGLSQDEVDALLNGMN